MMRLCHVLLKVSDLDDAVDWYRKNRFEVEYGEAKKPNNGMIYFANGTYLELLWKTGMPSWAQIPLRLFGKKAFTSRICTWDGANEGLIGMALESEPDRLADAKGKYRVTNMSAYNKSRHNQGDLTVLVTANAQKDWAASRRGLRSRQAQYSNLSP